MSNLKRDGRLRWSPSFLRRQGQMTPGQKRAYREWWPEFGLEFQHGKLLPLSGTLNLEIGFGMGENLIHSALANPEKQFVGIEVHKPGIAHVLRRIAEEEISNLRLLRGDARLILSDHIEGRIFESVSVLFPDPWPRSGDHHRRLVQSEFIDLLNTRVQPGGVFHFASDVDCYADSVESAFRDRAEWTPVSPPPRISTRYEEKGIAAGRRITDLAFRLSSSFP